MARLDIEGIKKPVADLYPSDVGLRCVELMIPDHDGYLWILAGFVAILGKTWAWRGTLAEREARAQLWQQAYAATEWEQCMECSDVADCIENDEGVQAALEQNLINNINNSTSVQNALQEVYNRWQGGQPMPPDVSGQDLLPPNPGCDLDKLFGSIFYTIDEMNVNNFDAFEAAEGISNVTERATLLIGAIPVFETLPVDEFIDYVQLIWTDDLFEAYSANDTTAYRDTLKCDLFCIARERGCVLSIDDMFQYFVSRIGADPQNDLIQLIAYLATGTWVGTQVNDIFYAAQIIVLKLGNQYFNAIGTRTYATYMGIGARTPNDTWMLICEECPSYWCYEWDFAAGEITSWDIGAGEYETGVGFVNDTGSAYPYAVDVGIECGDWGDSTLTDIDITAWTETADETGIKGAYYPPGSETDFTPNSTTGDYVAHIEVTVPEPENIRVQVSNNLTPGNNRISKVRMSGTGTLPEWFTGGSEC